MIAAADPVIGNQAKFERCPAMRTVELEQAHRAAGFAEREVGIVLSRTLMPLRHADRAAFMDEVRFNDRGNEITLIKRIGR